MPTPTFAYGKDHLTVGIALELMRAERNGVFHADTIECIQASRDIVDRVVDNQEVVYGVTTGFGPLCTTFISPTDARQLQHNLLVSHAVGVGDPLPPEVVRLMLILKLQALAMGYSGIRIETLNHIRWMLEEDILPQVPRKGSVGASGDLAPLAHLFLPLIGEGKVSFRGEVMSSRRMYDMTGRKPIALGPKEGIALINGTQFMAAYGVLITEALQRCLDTADLVAAMSLEALAGSARPFHTALHDLRPHPGNVYVAERLRALLANSDIMQSHVDCNRVQDPYSLRCIPQVHGASRQAWSHLKEVLETEMNSVTDNPILIDEQTIISGGNFHGQPIALPLDYAGLAAAELGNISERRIYLGLEGKIPGLPPLLLRKTGLNSGFMITQYTAAALVSENKSLCFPASADSIPTSMGQEDHVSMGSISGRKTWQIVRNLEHILSIELLHAAQGLDFRRPLNSSPLLDYVHARVREQIPHRESDTSFTEELQLAWEWVHRGTLLKWLSEAAEQQAINLQNQRHERYGIY